MIEEVIVEGPSLAEAIDTALDQMGVQQDAVEYEVLSEESVPSPSSVQESVRVRVWLKPEYRAEVNAGGSAGAGDDGQSVLSDEELDAVADAGIEAIEAIMARLGLAGQIDEYEGDEGEVILDITGDDLGVLIGRHGKTLDALQVIVTSITSRKLNIRCPLTVDVSGYRHRRRMKLEEIAQSAAEKAVRLRRPVQLRPMSGFERRVVHMALRNDSRVETGSEGVEPRRMVVVRPR